VNEYIGLVASKCNMCNAPSNIARTQMTQSPHYARTNIRWLKLVIPNWYVKNSSPFNEIACGSAATVRAGIEYPRGKFTQVLFSGGVDGTIPDGESLVSDQVDIAIPDGALFWVRMRVISTTNTLSRNFSFNPNQIGAVPWMGSELNNDKTMSGTITPSSGTFNPIAIIGPTTKPSIAFLGDSIGVGEFDTRGDLSGNYGMTRSFGGRYAYLSFAQSGDRAFAFLSSGVQRANILQYASHLVCAYGNNDVYTLGHSAAVIWGELKQIYALMKAHGAGKKTYQTTITVRTTSSDGWTTLANQTTTNGNTVRVALNALIRGGDASLDGYIDVADAFESARDSGKWKPGPSANLYTSDGTHPVTQGYLFLKESGIFHLPDPPPGGVLSRVGGDPNREHNQGGAGILQDAAGPKD
jgi:hypothetical protein